MLVVLCLGKKNCVSVKTGVTKIHVQKRLVLGNLKELYELFKKDYPNEKIGFSKFAELRPKHCVLAGGSGTHSVCVCTTHQNVKLMIEGAKLKNITLNDGTSVSDYKSCLARIMCNEPGTACHLNECSSCPGVEYLKQELSIKLEEEMIDVITVPTSNGYLSTDVLLKHSPNPLKSFWNHCVNSFWFLKDILS